MKYEYIELHHVHMQDFMTLRPFNINDAPTILSWCKDKHAFRLWSADRYKDFPAKPEEMMEQLTTQNVAKAMASKCYASPSIMRSRN